MNVEKSNYIDVKLMTAVEESGKCGFNEPESPVSHGADATQLSHAVTS